MIPIEGVLDHYEVIYDIDRETNQKVRCPFHDDSVASASVNLGMGLFNCYGCEVAGDAIRLLQLRERLGFGEAKQLAQELARGCDREVSRGSDRGDSLLPRASGARQNRRGWRSPWART